MELEYGGHWHLPNPIALTLDALGGEVRAHIGGYSATLTLPILGRGGLLVPPPGVDEPRHVLESQETRQSVPSHLAFGAPSELEPVWGWMNGYVAEGGTTWAEVSDVHLRLRAVSSPPAQCSLAEAGADNGWWNQADEWLHRLLIWIEVLSEQDFELDLPLTRHRARPRPLVWCKRCQQSHNPAHLEFRTYGRIPATRDQWVVAVRSATSGMPPEARLLLREARASFRRMMYRKAVLDAGLAAELALVQLRDAALQPLDEPVRSAIQNERGWTLGRLVAWHRKAATPLPEDVRDLVEARNDAAHGRARRAIDKERSLQAVRIASEMVERVWPV